MKAYVWGCCGSLPAPAISKGIRQKVRDAVWAARDQSFESPEAIDEWLDAQPHSASGTYKANTSCVQILTESGGTIICDAGSGLRDFSQSLGSQPDPATYHIFISHLHWDHIQGFPFFAPAYRPGNRIIFHGFHPQIESAIRQQMQTPCYPIPFEGMQANIEFDIREEGADFELGQVKIDTIKQQHPGDSWGYRFSENGKTIVYSSDSEHGPKKDAADYPFVDFFRDADVLIFDGQYTFEEAATDKRYWGHSDHRTAVELATRAGARKLLICHHEPANTDAQIESILQDAIQHCQQFKIDQGIEASAAPKQILLAYDGMRIVA